MLYQLSYTRTTNTTEDCARSMSRLVTKDTPLISPFRSGLYLGKPILMRVSPRLSEASVGSCVQAHLSMGISTATNTTEDWGRGSRQ